MLKTIEEEWLGFAEMVIPGIGPGSVQYDEMKKAFFAGVWVVQNALLEIAQPHISEDEGIQYFESIADECEAFKSKLMREYGERN
jgi:hypothetical protein